MIISLLVERNNILPKDNAFLCLMTVSDSLK